MRRAATVGLALAGTLGVRIAHAAPERGFAGTQAVAAEGGETPQAAPAPAPREAGTPTTTASPPGTATTAEAARPDATAEPEPAASPRRRMPARLVLAGGPVVGPHAFGNEECRTEEARCETHGTFFGVGLNTELRVRLWRPVVGHVRGLIVGNASPRDPVHRGLIAAGFGVGAYGRRIYGRAEYLLLTTLGDDQFARPFGDADVGRDRWGHHAGAFTVGVRLPFRDRWGVELWGGPMVGPRSVRTLPPAPADRRTLVTFLVGINVAYDLVPKRDRPSATRPVRAARSPAAR